MQCFTRGHKYPRTTLWNDYPAPPLDAYKKRKPFKPEATVIGRPWCPGAVAMPPPWQNIKRLQYDPVDFIHRETHMPEMLEFINKVNWSCGGDMESMGPRKSKISDSVKHSIQSTVHHDYRNPGLGKPPLRNPARATFAEGATPDTYHLIPFKEPDEHWLLQPIKLDKPEPPFDPNTACKVTVPHFMPDPPPGAALPPGYKSSWPVKPTTSKMGLVR